MTTKIVKGDIPYGIYEGIIGGDEIEIDGRKEIALFDVLYRIQVDIGARCSDCPAIFNVKNNEKDEKIIEITFKK